MGFLTQIFLNPAFLLGAVAAGVPIVIHLIHKRQAQKVYFSTLRFLRISNQRTSRRKKLEDLLLLLLRSLALLLLAIALAKPFLRSGLFGSGPSTKAVIILDNSYSMGTTHGKSTRYDLAKEACTSILELMKRGDFVALIPGFPTRSQPELPLEEKLEKVSREIMRYELTQGRAELSGALTRAEKLLAETSAGNKEIYIITDLQANSWSEVPESKDKKKPNIFIYDCGGGEYRNLALRDVKVRGKSFVKNIPIMIEGAVKSHSPQEEKVAVSLYIDGEKKAQRAVQVSPGAQATVSFTYVFDRAGVHIGRLALEPDSLPLDNERHFKVKIREKIDVLIVQDLPSDVSFLDESFYLARALDPFSVLGLGSATVISPTIIKLSDIISKTLERFPVVFILNVRNFRAEEVSMLKDYLRNGGALVFFAGPRINAKNYNSVFRDSPDPRGGLMPVIIEEEPDGFVDKTTFSHLAEIDFKHPVLVPFKGTQVFSQVKTYKTLSLKVPENSPVRVLLALERGVPFLLEHSYRKGKVFLFTTTANMLWTNFPVTKLFLPLVHQLVYYVCQRTETKGEYVLGSTVTLNFDDPRKFTVEVRYPDRRRVAYDTTPTPTGSTLTIDGIEKIGVYEYFVPGRESLNGAFVINPDTNESDLTRINQEALRRMLPGRKIYFTSETEELKKLVRRMREGIELWDPFLYLVLAILLFECFFANRVMPSSAMRERRRHYLSVTSRGIRE